MGVWEGEVCLEWSNRTVFLTVVDRYYHLFNFVSHLVFQFNLHLGSVSDEMYHRLVGSTIEESFHLLWRIFLDISPIDDFLRLIFSSAWFEWSHEHILMHSDPFMRLGDVQRSIGNKVDSCGRIWYCSLDAFRIAAAVFQDISFRCCFKRKIFCKS